MTNKFLVTAFLLLSGLCGFGQKITYADILTEDKKGMDFEILGKFGDNFLIYKNYDKKPYITIYDNNMVFKENVELDFFSKNAIDVSFVKYADKLIVFYQFQKGNIVYCNASILNSAARMLTDVRVLDTTKIRTFADNKFYGISASEDKKNILLYKMIKKDERLNIACKIFDDQLQPKDSVRQLFDFDSRRETYKDLSISNNGDILFLKEKSTARSDYSKELTLFDRKLNTPIFTERKIDLKDKRIDDSEIKIDNINKQFVVAAFSLAKNTNNLSGMFVAIVPEDTSLPIKSFVSALSDSLKSEVSNSNTLRDAFDRYFIKSIVLKKDGGFFVTTEEQYSEYRGNNWNRYNSPYNYYNMSDYYYYYPRYSGMYSPFGYDRYSNSRNEELFYANNIVTFNFNKDMNLAWTATINKKTSDLGSKDFLSYSTANYDGEVHFLFIQNDNNKQIISNFGMRPDGTINRYPTLKSRERGYIFMPSYAKQVSAREVIMPCILRNNMAFVKLDF